ncbi:MAG: hypothetical protein AVDCRST_MAG48-3106 [uncultured Friedmanniella sp.]|uniref:Uncharacterized protein n=1 Tax=uncultured Friedmanniella sp. TaxID=335381 RepID=A0A6J4LES3_9ACTN|nr:MAG: hypothetical protein AVDCRST_MAG48-3106 [uncultured Friedmanniella sp.]
MRSLGRLLRQGPWSPLARGLCWTRGGEPTWLALAWGGVLLGGDHARLGPESSAHLWSPRPDPPPLVDVLVPYGRGCGVEGTWRFQRERPGVRSPRTVGAPPRLTAADTVLDAAARRPTGRWSPW